MKNILEMGKEDLFALDPAEIDHLLTPQEMIHIAKTMDSFWQYDYEAAKLGRVGRHALLKSGRHSDGFFISRILLERDNICELFAIQMAIMVRQKLREARLPMPQYVAGIPAGATRLGLRVSHILEAELVSLEKVDGRIKLAMPFEPEATVMLVEDFITEGTGFTEAILDIVFRRPKAKIFPWIPAIISRGGLIEKKIDGLGPFMPLPIAKIRINDWSGSPGQCPLCDLGSIPIKPKATNENWQLINASQKT